MNIRIKRGLDLPLDGVPQREVTDLRNEVRYAVKPPDVVGMTPRLCVAEGEQVIAGQALVTDKRDPRIALTSPVDGTIEAIVRGEKRALLEVVVKRNPAMANTQRSQYTPTSSTQLINHLIERGAWWMLRERPFGTIANPDHQPKGIFISLIDTNPLAPDLTYTLHGRLAEFTLGLQALTLIAPVHLTMGKGSCLNLAPIDGIAIHHIEGPHPAGNIGTQIAVISPINKGEYVWTIGAQDVANIGHLLLTDEYRPERLISVGGPAAKAPHYYRILVGSSAARIAEAQLLNTHYPSLQPTSYDDTRIVSGSVLSGTTISPDGFLGLYDQQLTLLPEGNHYDFMGWLMPGLDKYSTSKTFLSGFLEPTKRLLTKCLGQTNIMPNKHYQFNTNMHGSVRPYLFTGNFEKVFPFDIYPLQLIKACIVGDMELQEQLGIYEVEPEDFALCEFIDPSKTDIQHTIREALEALRKEATA